MVKPSGCVRVDEPARQVVGVNLAPVVVTVLEDLVADDPLLDLDVEEGRAEQYLAEERRGEVERLGGQGEREDAEVGLRRGVQVAADPLERVVHGVRAPAGAASRGRSCARGSG